MGSKQSTPTTTTTTTTPWSGVQPYLSQAYSQAQSLYNSGEGYYPNSTVAPLGSTTQQAINLTTQRALNGSPVQSAAQGQVASTASGQYLNNNPYLQNAIDSASEGVTRNFNRATVPAINASFSKSGRYGSGMQAQALNDATYNLSSQLGNISSGMAYSNYNDERARQLQASGMAPSIAGMDYTNLQALSGAGETLDNQAQAQLDDQVARYNYQNGGALDDYIARLNNAGAGNYKSEAKSEVVNKNRLTGGLGGVLAGASTGAKIGSMVPVVGTGFGALAGGAISGLGGYFG